MRKNKRREKCCRGCFAYVPEGSRKCHYCGYKFKSPSKYLFDKIRRVLHIESVYVVAKTKPHAENRNQFFTDQEIESLLKLEDFRIQMLLILDDLVFLDERALIELGETLSLMNEI